MNQEINVIASLDVSSNKDKLKAITRFCNNTYDCYSCKAQELCDNISEIDIPATFDFIDSDDLDKFYNLIKE